MTTPPDNAGSDSEPSRGVRWARILIVISGLVALYLIGQYVAELVIQKFGFYLYPRLEPMMHRLILAVIICYIVLLAIPFMPGVEVGLSLIAFLGPKIIFLVYVSTVFALALAYAVGRFIPVRHCALAFGFVGLVRAQELMNTLAPLTAEQRLAYLTGNAPEGVLPFFLRHRFIALAFAINLPGNVLIGGGGGIAMLAGMSGIFPFPMYLLTIALAVAPVPLVISVMEF